MALCLFLCFNVDTGFGFHLAIRQFHAFQLLPLFVVTVVAVVTAVIFCFVSVIFKVHFVLGLGSLTLSLSLSFSSCHYKLLIYSSLSFDVIVIFIESMV